ncbi:hypothetical protein Pint_06095 [Pistacia integerrima]|uniref:Uncharacterized protein n=1 Tax=Pistacia integerrima TaxID=434235 RepID=A0ACC0Z7D0_9ROSI|nr:hypothetical protein Pint_06095 [Pistacia integerrima]
MPKHTKLKLLETQEQSPDRFGICRGREMDIMSPQGKLAYFRIKELKDVLSKLGLPKQGKKQDLVDRISRILPDEGLAKIIDDTYRKMQISEATELATSGQTDLGLCNVKLETEVEDSINSGVRICCPCRKSFPNELMVQCVDPGCLVQQHAGCVIIPEKPMEEIPSIPPPYYCEMCRIKRADPFWLTVACLVSPMKLVVSNIPPDGTNPLQIAETTFLLTQAHKDLLQKDGYDIQAWCILLNDKVSFRMQWPQFADLQVNGMDFGNLFPLVKFSRTAAAPPAFPVFLRNIMVLHSLLAWLVQEVDNCISDYSCTGLTLDI